MKEFIISALGIDRPGIVEEYTDVILKYEGNVISSKMARLEDAFAMLMLISIDDENLDNLEEALTSRFSKNYELTIKPASVFNQAKFEGWVPYKVIVHGADHEGIIHHITSFLSNYNINIENLDTEVVPAPMSGTPLFKMQVSILVPPQVTNKELNTGLQQVADEVNVEIELDKY